LASSQSIVSTVTLPSHSHDAIILGAGAAGLMCAFEAGKRGRRVALLERADRIGKKILISGGGRCNFTNLHCTPENFLSENPDFARSALARYTPADFIALVRKHRIAFHEKTLGQLFCDDSASQITTMLETECREAGVQLFLNAHVTEITRDFSGFRVRTNPSDVVSSLGAAPFGVKGAGLDSNPTDTSVRSPTSEFRAATLVVATGGLSIPKMGATSFGYDLARQFAINIIPPRPALVPLLFNDTDRKNFSDLAGVSAEVIATCNAHSFREAMLFTHRGLSGPAILQASSYWRPGQPIHIDLAPGRDVTAALRATTARTPTAARNALQFLPKRLATRWLELNTPSSWTNASLAGFEEKLHAWPVLPAGTEGYAKAEVTAGGIDTRELSSKTMESRKIPGLYFIGEVVDVTGHLGGFNFQWAWSSAHAAAQSL
jgi:predicted flavoprotein YhiN